MMKKLSVLVVCTFILSITSTPALAQIGYNQDILEPGNPPGGTCDIIGGPCDTDLDCAGGALACINPTLKTWDETWDLAAGETMDMDIWVTDIPEPEGLLTAGFFITYDPALITVTNVVPNDTANGGQWDAGFTSSFETAPGEWFLSLGDFGCVAPDVDGDVFMGRATFESLAGGQADIVISKIPNFDTVIGCASGTTLDPQIADNTVIVSEGVVCDPPDCDDGISCTDDVCNVDTCENTPNDANCDDGLYCNGAETCDQVNDCQDVTPVDCPGDGLYCNGTEFCDEASDMCNSTGNPCLPVGQCDETINACWNCEINISPSSVNVPTLGIRQFNSTVSGNCFASNPDPLCYTWEVSLQESTGSNISSTGLYTAGGFEGTDIIKVTDTCNFDISDTAIANVIPDTDEDGVRNEEDNCPEHPNGPNLGTCVRIRGGLFVGMGVTCLGSQDCLDEELCDSVQLDFDETGVGDACECRGNFDGDSDIDGNDAFIFKLGFGRSEFSNPCPSNQ